MKRCPECRRDYYDDSLLYCLDDGSELLDGPSPGQEGLTPRLPPGTAEAQTKILSSGAAEPPEPVPARPAAVSNRGWLIIAALVFITSLGIGGYLYYGRGGTGQIDSIAVMPFANEGDADTEYLSQGLTESLIYRLSEIQSLKVSPSSSVLRYSRTNFDPVKVGQELGVDALVVGRIVQRGDDLVVSAELIDLTNNKSLWGEQYNRKLSELLKTQREIAQEIAGTLKIQVSRERGLTKAYTDNNEAYRLHLQGRFLAEKRTKPELERAIQAFRKAIQLDPNFALAYVGVADAYNAMPPYAHMAPKDAFEEARAAAMRALEIDPSLAEAHSAYGVVLAAYDWKWAEAERAHKRAIELAPNRENPYFYYATGYLMFVGRHDEAIAALRRAIEIEPKSTNSNARLSTALGYARQYDLALEQAKKAYDLDPNFVGARSAMMEALIRKESYDEACRIGKETLANVPDARQIVASLAYSHAKAGRKAEANEILAKIVERSKTEPVISGRVARIYLALGERDQAFEWMERSYRDHDWFLTLMISDPAYDEIRDDPRYIELIRRIGLPPR